MSHGWSLVAAVVVGLVLLWLVLLVTVLVAARSLPDRLTVRDALRLLPDVVRLLRRLAADPTLPRGVRVRLGLAVGYLLLPVDLVPDVLPVVGLVDDVVVVALVLRSVARAAGPEALERHWPGSPEGLAVLEQLARLPG